MADEIMYFICFILFCYLIHLYIHKDDWRWGGSALTYGARYKEGGF